MLVQTRRHSFLCHLLGIRNLVLAVNKMDLVGYDQAVFDGLVAEYSAFAKEIGIAGFTAMPISGFKGDNIIAPSENTPWYSGPPLLAHLETVELDTERDAAHPFRMPVQWVNRPQPRFPRVLRVDRDRIDSPGRCGAGAALGQDQHGQEHRHV